MSPCRPESLEALLRGELQGSEALALERHAAACTACAKELSWLAAEIELLSQRARRDPATRSSWRGVTQRLAVPRSPRWMQVGLPFLAACLLLVLWGPGPGPRTEGNPMASVSELEATRGYPPMTLDPEWVIGGLERRYQACLVATPNVDPGCERASEVPASFASP